MVDVIFSSPNETKHYWVLNNDINSSNIFAYNLMIEKFADTYPEDIILQIIKYV